MEFIENLEYQELLLGNLLQVVKFQEWLNQAGEQLGEIMSFKDPISDMITRIRNAQLRVLHTVIIPNSKLRSRILDVLKEEGYISNYKVTSSEKNNQFLLVDLKYNNGIPVIKEISRVSKPGRRIYTKADSIPKIQNGLGIAIVSTSKGIMTDNDARSKKIGGEIICRVF